MSKVLFPLVVLVLLLNGCGPIYVTKSANESTKPIPTSDKPFGICYFKYVHVKGRLTIDSAKDAKGNNIGIKASIDTSVLPYGKAYLYINQSNLFSDTIDFQVTETGIPSNSQTQATQQVAPVISDLAGAAAKIVPGALAPLGVDAKRLSNELCPCNDCNDLKPGYYEFDLVDQYPIKEVRAGDGTCNKQLVVQIEPNEDDTFHGDRDYVDKHPEFDGFCVYDPSPVKISIHCCNYNGPLIAEPTIVNSYKIVHVVNPHRNFLTNRNEAFTITNGVLTEVKYNAQSTVKGVSDLVLAPLKSVLSTLPTTQTQTTTSVQATPGKPSQTTNTYQVTIAPPKLN